MARPSSKQQQLVLPLLATQPAPGRPDGRALHERGQTSFVEMTCRSVLNWVEGSRMTDFYSANPYRGCEFGCLYCYARYTHEFLDRAAPEDFVRKVFVKVNAPEAFARDLKRAPHLAAGVHLGSATDPYQPAEARFRLTRRLLERLLPHRNIPLTLATKSVLVERDADLLSELSRRHRVKVVMTCVTLDRDLQRQLEPNAPPTERRLQALASLSARGIEVGMLLAPVLPGLNDAEEDLAALCARAREAGVGAVISQALFLPAASKKSLFPWLQANRPDLYPRYLQAYRAGREFQGPWREAVKARLARARARAGVGDGEVR
jgi:DNA repair photolyase